MSTDPTFSNLPLYALPAALVIALAVIPRARAAGKKQRAWFEQMQRAPGDLRPGPGHFEIEMIGEGPTNFGHSSEGKTPSAMPTLDTEAVTVQLCGGPRVRLAAGAKLLVLGITGATRRQGPSVTTPQGVRTPYSFEVPAGTRLHIRGTLVDPAGSNYREGAVLDLLPPGKEYMLTEKPFGVGGAHVAFSGIFFSVLGVFGGMFLSNASRGGCNSKSMPVAVFVDALCIAAVVGALGLHYGVKLMKPPAT